MFTTDFNNEDGFPYPTPAEVDEIEGLELVELPIEEENDVSDNN